MTRTAPGKSRSYWLTTLRRWHWISSAITLSGLLLFSLTGVTLNHAAQIEARPTKTTQRSQLPVELLPVVSHTRSSNTAALPESVSDWLNRTLPVRADGRAAEWSDAEVYISLPRPGGDAWVSIDRRTGAVIYERTDRGWISYLNDLHKGRDTGALWRAFIDVLAAACVIFAATGLVLLYLHSRHRPATWPLVALGLLGMLCLAIFSIH